MSKRIKGYSIQLKWNIFSKLITRHKELLLFGKMEMLQIFACTTAIFSVLRIFVLRRRSRSTTTRRGATLPVWLRHWSGTKSPSGNAGMRRHQRSLLLAFYIAHWLCVLKSNKQNTLFVILWHLIHILNIFCPETANAIFTSKLDLLQVIMFFLLYFMRSTIKYLGEHEPDH